MKRVTEAKLISASRALLALAECDDIDAVLREHWTKVTERYYETSGGYRMAQHDEPPTSNHVLLQLANTLSVIAMPELT
jgi:hypothetical protein